MLFVGPSFFFLIRVGIRYGFIKAGAFALGIFLSDVVMVSVIYFGLAELFEELWFRKVFSLAAGLVVLGAGIYVVFFPKKGRREVAVKEPQPSPAYLYVVNGFTVNIMNPFTFGAWLTILSAVSVRRSYDQVEYLAFFVGMLSTILVIDLLKGYLANRLAKLMTDRVLRRLNLALGVIFMIFGLKLLFTFYQLMAAESVSFRFELFSPDKP
jgi:threonine/homoserine/homoserine lactone efflux protein